MAYTEQILYNVQLPQFLNRFKEACLLQLIPHIQYAIQFLKTTSSPILTVLLIVLFVELVRLTILQVRSTRKVQNVSQQPDGRAVAKEIKDLKRELKGMQKTVQQLKQLGLNSSSVQGRSSIISSVNTRSIIESCKDSWLKREQIALHIVQYQTLLMKEVRQLKRSGSRIGSLSKISNASPKETFSNDKNNKITINGPTYKVNPKVQPTLSKNQENIPTFQQIPQPPIVIRNQITPRAQKNREQNRRQELKPTTPKPKQQRKEQLVNHTQKEQIKEEVFLQVKKVEKPREQLQQDVGFQNNRQATQETRFEDPFLPKNTQTIQPQKVEEAQTLIQEAKVEQQTTIEQSPKTIPPLPKQPPSVVRRPPGPPPKGGNRNPPPPPIRKP